MLNLDLNLSAKFLTRFLIGLLGMRGDCLDYDVAPSQGDDITQF